MSVLSIHNLTYAYPGAGAPALRNVDLNVERGELIVVAGVSGSGKSTLLRAVSGLVPHFHGGEVSGSVVVAGLDTRRHGPGEIAAAVGTLFQDPETQVVMGTVRSELAFPLENRGASAARVARGVEEAALALGIAHLLERGTGELSGGELQRVALGAALAGRPALVVLDEPTSQLDPVAGDELIGLLRRLNEDFDTAILLAEHRLERCLPAADRVLALAGGRVVCDAPPRRFLTWAAAAAPPLATSGARLLSGLGLPAAASVKDARSTLREAGLLPDRPSGEPEPSRAEGRGARRRRERSAVLELQGVWHELQDGPAILRGLDLTIAPGELVALMGRNGAGKSTLLRHAAGLSQPTRGQVRSQGSVGLLLQNPNDYLVHETVRAEASAGALARVGLNDPALADRHPRELSGGQKQRLALAVVLGALDPPPALLCLDEPTRGMDRQLKGDLAALLTGLGPAVLVATHDPEFVAAFAQRVVLLADGQVIADGSVPELLCDGAYFATETARILGGAGGAVTAEDGLRLLAAERSAAVA